MSMSSFPLFHHTPLHFTHSIFCDDFFPFWCCCADAAAPLHDMESRMICGVE